MSSEPWRINSNVADIFITITKTIVYGRVNSTTFFSSLYNTRHIWILYLSISEFQNPSGQMMSVCHHNKRKLLNDGTLENNVIYALKSHSLEPHYAMQYNVSVTSCQSARSEYLLAVFKCRHDYSGFTELVEWNKQSAKQSQTRPFPILEFKESEWIFDYDYPKKNVH